MTRVDKDFSKRVHELVSLIPYGRVMTYGQIAASCGFAHAAWEVGQIAHFGPEKLPWHRVVNKKGGMAGGFLPGGPAMQRELLESEGVAMNDDGCIAVVGDYTWSPNER